MNVSEINPGTLGTMARYVEIALPLTIATIWIVIAFQSKYIFPQNVGFVKRLAWPGYLLLQMRKKRQQGEEMSEAEWRGFCRSVGLALE